MDPKYLYFWTYSICNNNNNNNNNKECIYGRETWGGGREDLEKLGDTKINFKEMV
jgi:hypothetical protein